MVVKMHILRFVDFPSQRLLTNMDESFSIYALGATNILAQSRELIKMGHKVTIFSGGGKTLPHYENIEGINIYRTILPRRGYYLPYSLGILPIYKKITKNHGPIDIVHAHSFKSAYGYSFMKPLLKKPLIISYHGYLNLSQIEKKILTKNLIKATDRLILVHITKKHYNEFRKLGIDESKIKTISFGIDTTQFKKKYRSKKIILSPNRLVKWKNTETFLKAAKIVLKKHKDYKFVIAGNGPEHQHLINLAKKEGITQNVDFAGIITPKEMVEYYSKAYATVSPMKIESFGKVILESLSCSCPVISTNFGIPKDIKKCGIFGQNPNDSKFFADAIIQLIEDKKLRNKLGTMGRKITINKYQWKKIANETLKVYEEIL